MTLTLNQVLLACGMLITGSINTLSKKAQNNCKAPGYYNASAGFKKTVHEFNHPWFQTLIMFLGEMLCVLVYVFVRWRDKRKLKHFQSALYTEIGNPVSRRMKPESSSLNNHEHESEIQFHNPKICHFIFIAPTFCDVFGTTLAGIGLLYVDASVWQMLRGSIIVFAGILSKTFLKRNLRCYHWTGITMTVLGLILVGLSTVLQTRHSHNSDVIIGILLILGGQVLSASQMIIEELFIKKHNFPPLHVVGMEGTFGVVIMICAILPALYFIPGYQLQGSYENSLDAIYQIGQNTKLLVFSLLYLASIAFYNFFGLAVTKSLTAVHRTLIDALRTMVVWAVGLFVYYVIEPSFGEPFDEAYGILQLDGFAFLLIGTAIYNGLMKIPCLPNNDETEVVVDSFTDAHSSYQQGGIDDNYIEQSLRAAEEQYVQQ